QPVGVTRIDDDLRDLLAIAQSKMGPRLPRVRRLVDAVAGREIGTLEAFPAAEVDAVRVRRSDGNRADGAGALLVKDRIPRTAVIRGLPDTAVHDADVEQVWLGRHTGAGFRATRAKRSDHS